jgi:hypothetical protein
MDDLSTGDPSLDQQIDGGEGITADYCRIKLGYRD